MEGVKGTREKTELMERMVGDGGGKEGTIREKRAGKRKEKRGERGGNAEGDESVF